MSFEQSLKSMFKGYAGVAAGYFPIKGPATDPNIPKWFFDIAAIFSYYCILLSLCSLS